MEIKEKVIILALIGTALVAAGILTSKIALFSGSKIEVVKEEGQSSSEKKIRVEISGSVNRPGVYELVEGNRIDDLLNLAEGLSESADFSYVEKNINRAEKLVDGQKIYVPTKGEDYKGQILQTVAGVSSQGLVNINTASQSTLESLWGIGPVLARKIIEQRPYSTVEELTEKKIISENVYQKNKEKLTAK